MEELLKDLQSISLSLLSPLSLSVGWGKIESLALTNYFCIKLCLDHGHAWPYLYVAWAAGWDLCPFKWYMSIFSLCKPPRRLMAITPRLPLWVVCIDLKFVSHEMRRRTRLTGQQLQATEAGQARQRGRSKINKCRLFVRHPVQPAGQSSSNN